MIARFASIAAVAVPVLFAMGAGCRGPSQANIALRKQNAKLRDEITSLKRLRDGDRATIEALESHATTVPVLPRDRLARLFTTHGLRIGRLTGGADLDPEKPGDEGVKVYVVPTDEEGEEIKAAGSFQVEIFDLAAPTTRLGEWTFSTDEARKAWFGQLWSYGYILPCPWQTVPTHAELTVKITFVDELTGRRFTAQKPITINPPPTAATAPATRAAPLS